MFARGAGMARPAALQRNSPSRSTIRRQLTVSDAAAPVHRAMPGLLVALITAAAATLLAFVASPELAALDVAPDVAVGIGGMLALTIALRLILIKTVRGAWLCVLFAVVGSSQILLYITPADPFTLHEIPTNITIAVSVSFIVSMAGIYLLGRSVGMTLGNWLDGLLAGAGLASLITLAALLNGPPVTAKNGVALFQAQSITAQCLLIGSMLALAAAVGWRRQSVWILLITSQSFGVLLHSLAPYLQTHFPMVTGDQFAAFGRFIWFVDLVGAALAAWVSDPHAETKPNARRAALSAAILPLVGLIATAAVLMTHVFVRLEGAALFPAVAASTLATLRISQAIRGAEAFRHLSTIAITDELTGLANRRQLYHAIEEVLAKDSGSSHALMLLDLNAFKEVNDSLGHPVGDALLVRLGARLSGALPDSALLARLGGDEFAVLLPNSGPSAPASAAQDIRQALRAPFSIQGVRLQVGCSIGSARYPIDGKNAVELLSRADIAMYHAKRSGKTFQQYLPELESDTLDRLELLADLDAALTSGQFECVFQPKMEVGTGRIVSAEALVRWRHPERGLLSPATFLELVEQTGTLPALTSVVLDHAITAAAAWHKEGFDISVAVNVGSGDLLDDQLVDGLLDRLARHGLPPHVCIVEVTEGAFIDADPSERVVRRLALAGVPVAIDDYGAGYSSLSRLRALQANQLKLDRSLISAMTDDPGAAAVVRSSIQLAHALHMRLVAEGVEDVSTLQMLSDLGCDEVQGYLIARPMAAPALMEWLLERAKIMVA